MDRVCKTCKKGKEDIDYPPRSLDCRVCRNLWRKIHHRASCTGNLKALKVIKKGKATRDHLMRNFLESEQEGIHFDMRVYVAEFPPEGVSEEELGLIAELEEALEDIYFPGL